MGTLTEQLEEGVAGTLTEQVQEGVVGTSTGEVLRTGGLKQEEKDDRSSHTFDRACLRAGALGHANPRAQPRSAGPREVVEPQPERFECCSSYCDDPAESF